MKKKQRKSKGERKAQSGSASKVVDRIRSNSLAINADSFPAELLDDVRWVVDRGLEKRVWELLEEDLPEESSRGIVFALRLAASRLTLLGSRDTKGEEIEELQPMVIIPFAILFSATFLAGEAAQFPIELPDSIGRAVESGLMHQALGAPDDITVFVDPRLYQPQHHEWLRPSATRRYLKSIAEHLPWPATPVAPLSSGYKLRLQPGPLPDAVGLCQRLICGAIVTAVGEEGHSLAEASELLFGDREDESGVMEEKFRELNRLIEDELAVRCLMTESTVLTNPTPIELWDVPRFVFQVQRTVSLGVALEMALEGFRETEASQRELKSSVYVSMHGSEENLKEFRFAAYLVDEKGTEEEGPFFSYAWEVAFELEEPEDIDEAIEDIADQLNASVTMVEALLPDERCEYCGARFFRGPGGHLYHEDVDDCPPLFEN